MALIKCEECGQMVSDKASDCPHCGCPVEAPMVCPECGSRLITNGGMTICNKCLLWYEKENGEWKLFKRGS